MTNCHIGLKALNTKIQSNYSITLQGATRNQCTFYGILTGNFILLSNNVVVIEWSDSRRDVCILCRCIHHMT